MKRYPSCIMATCCVPWSEQWRLEESIFRRTIRASLAGTKHLYLFGTAGEGYAVTDTQFDQIVAIFADEMRKGGAEPMVGVINLSLGVIQERIARCRDQGVKRFQISLPGWGALNQKEVFTFFDQVCGRFTDCQFLHYNLMRTKRLVTPEEYGQLSAIHPNLVATKNSNDSFSVTQKLIEQAPDLQHFLTETAYIWASQFGECGILASLVTSFPRLQKLYDAGQRRDAATMIELQREMQTIYDMLGKIGDTFHIDGAYDKMFARINDPEFPIRLLPPYNYASEEQFQKFAAAFRQAVPQWIEAR